MSEWKKVKLGEIISISSGFSYKSDYLGEGDNLLLGMGCVSYKDSFVDSGARPYSQDCDEKYLVKPGDIVLATRQQSNNLPILAMPAVIPQKYAGKKLIVGANLYKVENHSNIDNRFIYYLLKGYDYVGYINGVKTGANVQMVSKRNVEAYSFLCPPLETCNRIATILSRYDSLIENYQKQIKLLEEAAQRLYKEWFIDLHFPGHENINIIDGLPEGWEKKKLCEIAEVVMGSSPKSEFYNTDKQGLPFHQGVGSYGVRFVEDNIYSTAITRLAEADSILFSVRAPVGRLNITKNKIIIGRGLAAMNHKQGCQSFLFYMLKERFFKDNIIGNGSIFASISKDDLLSQIFIVPNDDILKRFESFVSKIDNNIKDVDTQLRLLTEARDRLLPKLMSGAIEV